MQKHLLIKRKPWRFPLGIAILLFIVAQYSAFSFHLLIELLSVIIVTLIFALVWSTKKYVKSNLLLFLGYGFIWVGYIDLTHLLIYKLSSSEVSINIAMQFWIVEQFLEALLFLGALFVVTQKYSHRTLFIALGGIAIGLSVLISQGIFPTVLIEEQGASSFKLYSECLIAALMILALGGLSYIRKRIVKIEKKFIVAAIAVSLSAQLVFIFDVNIAGRLNILAHIGKLFSYWLIFNAVVILNLQKPYALLHKNREDFKRIFDNSEVSIWNVDFSKVVAILDELKAQGITDLNRYFQENKRKRWELAPKVQVLQVNKATLALFSAKEQDEFLSRINEIFTSQTLDIFIKGIHAIWEDRKSYRAESLCRTLDGTRINCIISFQVPEVNENFKSIPVTLVDITHRKENEARIWRQGNFDSLTGLVNRNLFSDRLSHALDSAKRNNTQLALLYLDLDGFKHVNDTQGHLVGDKLLQEASLRLLSHMRSSDTVARLGGDEFAIILPKINNIYDIEATVNKIQHHLALPYNLQGHVSFVSASIGITVFPDDGDDTVTLLRKADNAMYQAKKKGRSHFQFFTEEIEKEAMRRKELEEALHDALDNGDFFLHYQPVIDLKTGDVSAAEALIRWQPPGKERVLPSEFIPLAEEIGLIVSIGEWVLREACREAETWSVTGKEAPSVAVNLSSRQFQGQDVALLVSTVLLETGLAPQKLVLEITESLLLADNEKVLQQLQDIRNLGVRFSIDDFGTGYSSLSYLKKFPVDSLKIDQSFIMNLPMAAEDVALVNAILSMAESLGLNVVAEGVETESQADFIKSTNCQYLQGYLYSKPLARADFVAYFQAVSDEQSANDTVPLAIAESVVVAS